MYSYHESGYASLGFRREPWHCFEDGDIVKITVKTNTNQRFSMFSMNKLDCKLALKSFEKTRCSGSCHRHRFLHVVRSLFRHFFSSKLHSNFVWKRCAKPILILTRFWVDLGSILGAFFVFAWGDRAKTFAFEAVPALGLCFGDAKDSFQGVFRRICVSLRHGLGVFFRYKIVRLEPTPKSLCEWFGNMNQSQRDTFTDVLVCHSYVCFCPHLLCRSESVSLSACLCARCAFGHLLVSFSGAMLSVYSTLRFLVLLAC